MPIGPFRDFNACVAHMTKPKSEGGGGYDGDTARKICGKMKAELEESFSWAGDVRSYPGARLIRGEAIHPVKTFHPLEWPQLRVFLEDELEKSAETLVGKPLFLDHWRPLNGKVLGARYEDGALEYVAELKDDDVLQMIRDGKIRHASVQFGWKILEQIDGVAPRGINYQHLSLLKDMLPGDSRSTVEIWESIARQLKEARSPPPNPKTGSETVKVMNEKQFKESLKKYPDYTQAKYLRLFEAIVPLEQLAKLLEAEWDTEYINNLDDDCFAYIEPGGEKDEQGKKTPRSLRHFPYKNAQGNLSPDHIRNGLARLGQELGDWATADAKAQIKKKLCAAAKELEIESEVCGLEEQAGEEPPKAGEPKTDRQRFMDHYGLTEEQMASILEWIGEDVYKLLPPRGTKVQEQQGEEPKKDEHGCVIGKQRWDEESQTCVPIPPAELQEQQDDDHQAFMAQCMAAGKTMEQCAAEWRQQHPEETPSVEEANKTIEALKAQIQILTEQKKELQEELKKKTVGEAIIPSSITPPSDVLKEIKRLLPERVPMSWGGHYAQLWRNLRNIIKKHESQSQP